MTTSGASDTYTCVRRIVAAAICVLALGYPAGASAQTSPTLNGTIEGLQLPMRLAGTQVTYLSKGAYTFSLLDNSGQHSIHVVGPLMSVGYTGNETNFGTAGADGVNVPATGTFVFPDVLLKDGLYRWHCDRHSDMMWGSVMVGNYLSVDVSGRGSVSSFPVNFLCRGNCGLGVPDGAAPVALVATPKLGYVFDRWEGACSGNGECSLNVTGLLQTRAVFREVSAGAISKVKVTKAKKKRTVAVTVTLTDPAMTTIQVRARGRLVTALTKPTTAAGTTTFRLAIPKATKAGAATVQASFKRAASLKSFAVSQPIRIPKL